VITITDALYILYIYNIYTYIHTIRAKVIPGFISHVVYVHALKLKLNSMVRVRERTIPTERPPLVGEVIANFCG
jgi:hypothetical protein